jgi:hypothetical protein
MTHYHPDQFAKKFEMFTPRSPQFVCEFDASLEGVGILWFARLCNGAERPVAYTTVDLTPLGFGTDSSFQNTAEYIAGLLSVIGMVMLGKAHLPCMFRGDSLSALTWIDKGGVRSDTAIKAAVLWAQAAVTFQVAVTGSVHIDGKSNSRTDRLSRNGSWQDVLEDEIRIYQRRTLPASLRFLDLNPGPILALCNPSIPIGSETEFITFLGEARDLFASLPVEA